VALEFVAFGYELVGTLPAGSGDLADQLKRAATSIPLNISEGSGRTRRGDRARFHAIARGSAMECAAILDVLRITNRVGDQAHDRGKRMLGRIVAMLSKMSRAA
jgi:four helix bundle protein